MLECDVEQVDSRSFSGRLRTKIWVDREYSFALEFDHDVNDIYQLPPRVETENGPRGILSFDMPAGGTLMMKVAFSTVSPEAAARNLAAEIPGWDFDGVRAAANPGGSQLVATADAINCVPPAAADAQERVPPRTFTIIAKNLSKENKYVKSITLNGKPLTGKAAVPAAEVPILRHADIMRGGELLFEMAVTP